MADDRLNKKEIPLTGKLILSEDGILIGNNYSSLKNMRYTEARVKGIAGMTKINTTALANPKVRSAHHFVKDQPAEGHVLVQAFDANGANPKVYKNDTAIPSAGDFTSTALHTDDTAASTGYFASAPNGSVVYCNSKESLIWGGNEFRIGSFVNYDPNQTFRYDYTEVLRNTQTGPLNRAPLHGVVGGIDANVMLLLHLNDNVTDFSPATVHTVTNTNATFDATVKKFGTHSAVFDGATAYLTIPDDADFDLSGGAWTLDGWFRTDSLAAAQCIYSQRTDATNFMRVMVSTTGVVSIRVAAGGAETSLAFTPAGTIAVDTWYHIEVSDDGTTYRIFIDGALKATAASTTGAANYTQVVFIGAHHNHVTVEDYFNGYMDELRLSNVCRHTTAFEVPAGPYSNTAEVVYCYVGATRPISGMKIYVQTANGAVGTVGVDYWDGSTWTAVSSLADGTSGFTATGSITFSDTASTAKISVINGNLLYFYRLTLSSSSGTIIYYATLSDSMQDIVDVWDGNERSIASFQTYVAATGYASYTTQVFDNTYSSADAATYCNVGALASGTDYFVVGFMERMTGVHFHIGGDKGNTTANTICSVSYWNGSAWTSVGAVSDGTATSNMSLSKTGIVSWNSPTSSSEFKQSLSAQNDTEYYYYKFAFDHNLSADVFVFYATGLPAQTKIGAYKFPISAMNRVFLCNHVTEYKNSVRYSSDGTCDVYNGSDSSELFFGDETELTAGCWLYSQYGTTLYNTLVFTKAKETHILVGNDPSGWAQHQASPNVGCIAPKTMCVISAPHELYGGSNRTVAIWQAMDGIYLFDGKGLSPIHKDIESLWKPDSSVRINTAIANQFQGFYDNNNQEYHWLCATGSNTTLNKEFVYDIARKKWFEIDRGTGKYLQCGVSVSDTNGNAYAYGFIDTGYCERLEYGTTLDGSDIGFEIATGDMLLADGDTWFITELRRFKLLCVAKTTTANNITLTHYGDTSSTPTTFTFSPAKSGYRVANPKLSLSSAHDLGKHVFHKFKLSMTTNDEAVGFEPLHWSVFFRKVREDTGD